MNLFEQRAAALARAKSLVDGAKAAARDLTPDEQSEVQSSLVEVKDLDVKIKGQALVASVASLGSVEDVQPDGPQGPPQAKSLGEHFAQHVGPEGFAKLKTIGGYTASTPEYGVKANTDPLAVGQFGIYQTPLLTDFVPGLVRQFRPGPVVADLLGSGQVSGNAVTYFVEGALEGDFATVPELGQKPQLHMTPPTSRTDALKKIAAWWDTSDEMVEDLAFMVSEINNRAMYRLGMFEEAQLLTGDGAGTNVLGLLNRSGIQTEAAAAGGEDNADAIFRAMTKVQTATGFAADGVVINPVDYQKLRLNRDGNGQYYGGGYFQPPYGEAGGNMQTGVYLGGHQPVWGLRTVVSTATAPGQAIVGAFTQAATVYRKGGVRVESTNSDQGKFTSNIITTRIEERVALACHIPAAVVKVTLT